MKFIKRNIYYILIFLIIPIYIAILFVLRHFGFDINVIENITIIIGWLLALGLAIMHLQKNREDNIQAFKNENRKKLEIDALREINKKANKLSSIITSFTTMMLYLPVRLKQHIDNPKFFKFDKNSINLEVIKYQPKLRGVMAEFIIAIESNEIVVIKYDHLRKYIQHVFDNAFNIFNNFDNYLLTVDEATLLTKEGVSELSNYCNELFQVFQEINSYLFDYRIEIMNSLLGGLFDQKVPERRPLDPSFKILTEVATKEKVKEIEDARKEEFLRNYKK